MRRISKQVVVVKLARALRDRKLVQGTRYQVSASPKLRAMLRDPQAPLVTKVPAAAGAAVGDRHRSRVEPQLGAHGGENGDFIDISCQLSVVNDCWLAFVSQGANECGQHLTDLLDILPHSHDDFRVQVSQIGSKLQKILNFTGRTRSDLNKLGQFRGGPAP